MSNQASTPLRRVSILAIDRVFASTLMQAKDFFHLASLRYGKQLGHGLTPAFETRLVSPDGQPVNSFSDVKMPVDGGLENADIIVIPAFWDDFDTLCKRYPQVLPWLRQQHARGAVLCGEATGVFWLAEAGCSTARKRPPTGASSMPSPNAFPRSSSTRTST
jgi:transcriptional regulator GlxA family with amidase domain